MDDPDHGRLRCAVTPEFTHRRIQELRPGSRATAERLFDEMARRTPPVDFIEAVALPLPALGIDGILGVPEEDLDFFGSKCAIIASTVDSPEAIGAPSAVDELLRILTIVQHGTVRVATRDVTIGELTVTAGDGVICSLLAADHDESVFPDAGRFDVRRNARAHLAFGHGVHQCLGQPLARAELEIVLRLLFAARHDVVVASGRLPDPGERQGGEELLGVALLHHVAVAEQEAGVG
ncbi:cytochrome P450 [Streptomyces sp. NPDC050211]|uniref:cytochrome P450 n=1 Tax=Streptomyces sp. NPDC050211 TaxID=3154932 RepID=UPI003444495F